MVVHHTVYFGKLSVLTAGCCLYKTTNTGTTDKTTSQFRAKKIFIGAFQETQGHLAVQLCGGQKEAFSPPQSQGTGTQVCDTF